MRDVCNEVTSPLNNSNGETASNTMSNVILEECNEVAGLSNSNTRSNVIPGSIEEPAIEVTSTLRNRNEEATINTNTMSNMMPEEGNEVTSPLDNSGEEMTSNTKSNVMPISIEEPVIEEPACINVENKQSNVTTSPLKEVTGLYEAASNIVSLREARQDCIVRKMFCQVHNQEAKRYTSTKSVWTRNKKTGLYGYRSRKLSVVRCNGSMGISLGTMGMADGAGKVVEIKGDIG